MSMQQGLHARPALVALVDLVTLVTLSNRSVRTHVPWVVRRNERGRVPERGRVAAVVAECCHGGAIAVSARGRHPQRDHCAVGLAMCLRIVRRDEAWMQKGKPWTMRGRACVIVCLRVCV